MATQIKYLLLLVVVLGMISPVFAADCACTDSMTEDCTQVANLDCSANDLVTNEFTWTGAEYNISWNSVTISEAGTYNVASGNITVVGTTYVFGTLTAGSGSHSFSSGLRAYGIRVETTGTFIGGTGDHTMSSLRIAGDCTLTSGTTTLDYDNGSGNGIVFYGTPTFDDGDGTVIFSHASATQKIYCAGNIARTFYNLIIDKSSGIVQFENTVGFDLTIDNDFTIASGTFDTSEVTTGTSRDLIVIGDVDVTGTLIGNAGSHSFGSLTINTGGTYEATSGNTTITSQSPTSYMFENNGNFIHNSGTLVLTDPGTSNIGITGTGNLNNVISDKTNNLQLKTDFTIDGDFDLIDGNLYTSGSSKALTVIGDVIIYASGNIGTLTSETGPMSFGSIYVKSGGTYSATSGITNITNENGGGQAFYNDGIFTHNDGILLISTPTQTIVASGTTPTTAYNLVFSGVDNSGLTRLGGASTWVIDNDFNITSGSLRFDYTDLAPVTVGGDLNLIGGDLLDNIVATGVELTVTGDVVIESGNTLQAKGGDWSFGSLEIKDGGLYDATSGTTTITDRTPAGYTIKASGTGTRIIANDGLFNITGNSGGNINAQNNAMFYNIDSHLTGKLDLQNQFTQNGTFTVYDGTVEAEPNTGIMTIGDLVLKSGTSFGNTALTGDWTIGSLIIEGGAEFTASSGIITFTKLAGDILNFGTFNHNEGTVRIGQNTVIYNNDASAVEMVFYNFNADKDVYLAKDITIVNNLYGDSRLVIYEKTKITLGNSTQKAIVNYVGEGFSSASNVGYGSGELDSWYILSNSSSFPAEWSSGATSAHYFDGKTGTVYLENQIINGTFNTDTGDADDINLIVSNVTFGNLTVTVNALGVNTFNITAGDWVNFTGNFVHEGNFTLSSEINYIGGYFNVTENLILDSLANASQSSSANFGSLIINNGGTYSATNGTTTITSETSTPGGTTAIYNAGNFIHNNGRVKISLTDTGQNTVIAGTTSFYDFEVAMTAGRAVYNSYNFLAENDLTITSGNFYPTSSGYSTSANGNIVIENTGVLGGGSQSADNYFGSLTINNGGTYDATSGTTTIRGLVDVFDQDRINDNGGVFYHNAVSVQSINYTNNSFSNLTLTGTDYTATSDIYVENLTIESGTTLSVNADVLVSYCVLYGDGTTTGDGIVTSHCRPDTPVLHYPVDEVVASNSSIVFNWTVVTADNYIMYLYDSSEAQYYFNDTIVDNNLTYVAEFPDGNYTWEVYSNDSTDISLSSENSSFKIDAHAPSIIDYSVTSGLTSGENGTIRANVTDNLEVSNVDSVWFTITCIATGSLTNVTMVQEGSTEYYNETFAACYVGTHYYQVFANDTEGNEATITAQELVISKPSATTSEAYPTSATPSTYIRITSNFTNVDLVQEVYAYLDIPSGFTLSDISSYPQNNTIGNLTADETSFVEWRLFTPNVNQTYDFNVTWSDDYANEWDANITMDVTYDTANVTDIITNNTEQIDNNTDLIGEVNDSVNTLNETVNDSIASLNETINESVTSLNETINESVSQINDSVTMLEGAVSVNVVPYVEIDAGNTFNAEIYVRDAYGNYTNATSIQVYLIDPLGDVSVGPTESGVSNISTGRYNYTKSTASSWTSGQWQILISIAVDGKTYTDRDYFKVTSGPFDVRNIEITDATAPSLTASVVLENLGNAVTDIVLDWNLTNSETGELLTSGQDTVGVAGGSSATHSFAISTTYTGPARLQILGYYGTGFTERAGAATTFTILQQTTSEETQEVGSDSGGSGITGAASIPSYAEEVLKDAGKSTSSTQSTLSVINLVQVKSEQIEEQSIGDVQRFTYDEINIHKITILSVGKDVHGTYVEVEIASEPKILKIYLADTMEIDVDDDGIVDIALTLNDVEDESIDITIENIREVVLKDELEDENVFAPSIPTVKMSPFILVAAVTLVLTSFAYMHKDKARLYLSERDRSRRYKPMKFVTKKERHINVPWKAIVSVLLLLFIMFFVSQIGSVSINVEDSVSTGSMFGANLFNIMIFIGFVVLMVIVLFKSLDLRGEIKFGRDPVKVKPEVLQPIIQRPVIINPPKKHKESLAVVDAKLKSEFRRCLDHVKESTRERIETKISKQKKIVHDPIKKIVRNPIQKTNDQYRVQKILASYGFKVKGQDQKS
jgi:hypothetical protein